MEIVKKILWYIVGLFLLFAAIGLKEENFILRVNLFIIGILVLPIVQSKVYKDKKAPIGVNIFMASMFVLILYVIGDPELFKKEVVKTQTRDEFVAETGARLMKNAEYFKRNKSKVLSEIDGLIKAKEYEEAREILGKYGMAFDDDLTMRFGMMD
jgi:hypothetical protein